MNHLLYYAPPPNPSWKSLSDKINNLEEKVRLLEKASNHWWLDMLPLLVPILVAVIAGFIAIWRMKINNRQNLELTRSNMLAAQRIEWMNEFRKLSSVFMAKLASYNEKIYLYADNKAIIDKSPDNFKRLFIEELTEMEIGLNQLKLMLNMKELIHKELDETLEELIDLVDKELEEEMDDLNNPDRELTPSEDAELDRQTHPDYEDEIDKANDRVVELCRTIIKDYWKQAKLDGITK